MEPGGLEFWRQGRWVMGRNRRGKHKDKYDPGRGQSGDIYWRVINGDTKATAARIH